MMQQGDARSRSLRTTIYVCTYRSMDPSSSRVVLCFASSRLLGSGLPGWPPPPHSRPSLPQAQLSFRSLFLSLSLSHTHKHTHTHTLSLSLSPHPDILS